MNPGLQISPQLTQSLVLSPQLQQSLALLQAPILELKALVEKELEQNPVLEELPDAEVEQQKKIEEDGEAAPAEFDPAEPPADVKVDPSVEEKDGAGPVDDFEAEFERLSQMDQEWREHFAQTQVPMRMSEEEEERRQFVFDSITRSESLQESLQEQVRMSDLDLERRAIAELIVGNIDEHGYLKAGIEELAATAAAPAEVVSEVLKLVQTFDPPGVGARDLRECLLIQLERAGRQESAEYRMVADHMDLLARRRVPELADVLALGVAEVQEAMGRIARLEPRPGRVFISDDEQYVIPEVFVRRVGDEFVVTTNNQEIPHLRISNTYKDLMSRSTVDLAGLAALATAGSDSLRGLAQQALDALQGGREAEAVEALRRLIGDGSLAEAETRSVQRVLGQIKERQNSVETRNYIRGKINAAKFLIKSIDLRQKTLLNIAREIVARQREFMEKGVSFLKPITMAQVAGVVGVHETTVSRAVAGKYMETPQGIFEMKFFFTAGLHTSGGVDIANTSVKGMVAEIFRDEDPRKPLADDEAAKMLQARGINIARRTIAKYRGELGILPSNLRKVY